MKKIYQSLLTLTMALCVWTTASAQSGWQALSNAAADKVPAPQLAGVTGGKIYVGHCAYDEYIYIGDGLSQSVDCRVGVAMVLTRDMFAPYIGAQISGLRVGWDTREVNGNVQAFVRTSFNGDDLVSANATVKYGWNNVAVDAPTVIPDVDTLVVGYYTNLVANKCCIPTFYPKNVPNACYLYVGEQDTEGNEVWEDWNEFGPVAVLLEVTDTDGSLNNKASIGALRYQSVGKLGTDGTGLFTIKNRGSNAITQVEVTTTVGEQTKSQTVKLSSAVALNSERKISLPISYLASGRGTVSITAVNNEAVTNPFAYDVTLMAVPEEAANRYTRRPLIEFFVSENSYMVPTYFDEYFMADFANFREDYTLVCQHTDDQFMTGDDDEIHLMLGLVANDSMKVYIPSMTIDRTDYLCNLMMVEGTPFLYGIPYPGMATSMYNGVLAEPTFASVDIDAATDDALQNINIHVSGTVEPGVMPADEPLFMTVYLMESQVESSSQKFWEDKEGEAPTAEYTHYNVVREPLTPLWGTEISPAEDGTYSMDFSARMYSDYDPANLTVIAFLHRGEQNDNMSRQVINSNEMPVRLPEGIRGVDADSSLEVRDGEVLLGGVRAEIFTPAGVRVTKVPTDGGVYLVRKAGSLDKALKVMIK